MRRSSEKPGFALMQVMIVVALVTVLSLVMLSESALQAQTSHNAVSAGQAECLAESGVNLAMYYLLNPWLAPSGQDSYWPGGSNISLGTGVSGVISQVTVTPQVRPDLSKPQEYVIQSTGTATLPGGATLSRSIYTRVAVNEGTKIGPAAMVSGAGLTIFNNTQVTGDVVVNGTLKDLVLINGKASYRALDPTSTGTAINGMVLLNPAEIVHAATDPVLYSPGYSWVDGKVYARTEYPGGILGSANVCGPTAANPAGIYHHAGTLLLTDNARVDGTLIVEGDVVLGGNNIVINAQSNSAGGYPALITTGDIRTANNELITLNGGVWCAKTIKSHALGSAGTLVRINGALLFGSAGGTVAINAGTVRVTWDPNRTVLPDMDRKFKRSLAIVYWNKQKGS